MFELRIPSKHDIKSPWLKKHSLAVTVVVTAFVLALASVIYSFLAWQELSSTIAPIVFHRTMVKTESGNLAYASKKAGISFEYPDFMQASEDDGVVMIAHSIPFENFGPCDMMGDGPKQERLTDFLVTLEVVNKKMTPRNDDGKITAGNWSGHYEYDGAEGCGQFIYYFPLEGKTPKTLVVTKDMVQALSGISSSWKESEILKVPGAISREKSDELFKEILSTLLLEAAPNGNLTEKEDKVSGSFCGGIAGFSCPDGYSCKYDGTYPDAGGVCVVSVGKDKGTACIEVITPAMDPRNGETKNYPTPCDVPSGWKLIN
ncbi:MAG: hypothetical protein ACM3KM_02540 [Acidobacteriaceae bacterium]